MRKIDFALDNFPIFVEGAAIMNSAQTNKRRLFDWRADLLACRDLKAKEKDGFGFFIGWMEDWRLEQGLAPGRDAARRFWRERVLQKPREEWQRVK